MADQLTDIWTTDGGSFSVLAPFSEVRAALRNGPGSEWIEVTRITWQDPELPDTNEAFPLVSQERLEIRASSITAYGPSHDGTVESLHRARVAALE